MSDYLDFHPNGGRYVKVPEEYAKWSEVATRENTYHLGSELGETIKELIVINRYKAKGIVSVEPLSSL